MPDDAPVTSAVRFMKAPYPGLVDLDRLDAVFGALSHRTRRAILVTLMAHGGSQT
ncbi:hypothetical protein Adu01nite_56000 [Paractinoplanes durhamensis]|uniref:Transcriptional regulator n=1 Tax=Paractinoplanes durhamensis TaxID=113563 RepID=A0ABQ3Z335_9ACTN|nr:hypothetical protein Adu01nite_56000 [Actinoplanes durhamensis]